MDDMLERLLTLRVKDVMSRDMITLRDNMTMRQAGETLHASGVSGAPVVDEDGVCIGVLSVADFAVQQTLGVGGSESSFADQWLAHETDPLATLRLLESPNEQVCEHMTLLVRSIDPDTPLLRAAQEMCMQHVHRLVVLNSLDEPVGMLSSLDIVAAVNTSFEEFLTHFAPARPLPCSGEE